MPCQFIQTADPPSSVVFVTGRGGAGFHSPDPALTRGRGGYVSGNPRPAPVRGPPALIPWTGPSLLPPIFNGDLSGVWVGRVPERGQGQGMPKKASRPRPLSRAGRGKGPGARVFRGPVRPVTNSSHLCRSSQDICPRRMLLPPCGIENAHWQSEMVLCRNIYMAGRIDRTLEIRGNMLNPQ